MPLGDMAGDVCVAAKRLGLPMQLRKGRVVDQIFKGRHKQFKDRLKKVRMLHTKETNSHRIYRSGMLPAAKSVSRLQPVLTHKV